MHRYVLSLTLLSSLLAGACAGGDGSLAAQGAVRVTGHELDSAFALGVFTRLADARDPDENETLVGYCEISDERLAAGISRPIPSVQDAGLRSFALRLGDDVSMAVIRVGATQYRVSDLDCEHFETTQTEGEVGVSLACDLESDEGEPLHLDAELHWEGCVTLPAAD